MTPKLPSCLPRLSVLLERVWSSSGIICAPTVFVFVLFVFVDYLMVFVRRRIEAAEDIATHLSQSRNVVYLPSGGEMLTGESIVKYGKILMNLELNHIK